MRVKFSPQRCDLELTYKFNNEVITATLDGETDTFDFSTLPDGVAEEVESTLPINPVVSAKRENGVLEVTLLKFHGPDATEAERFPEPLEVG